MPASERRGPDYQRAACIALAVIAGAGLSRWLSPGQSLSLIWAPAGFVFAVVWKYGRSALIPSAVGLVAWGAISYPSVPWIGVAAAIAETACSLATVAVLSHLLNRNSNRNNVMFARGMRHLHWLVRFYGAGLGVGAPVAACIGATGFVLSGLHPGLSFVEIWLAYWVIQSLGMLLIGPVTLAWLGADPSDVHAVPFPPRRGRPLLASQGIDHLSIIAVLLLTGVILAVRAAGHEEYIAPLSLAYIPAVAFCAVRRNALATYFTLALSGTVLCVALSFDANAMSTTIGRARSTMVPVSVFETIALVFVSTLLAQLLQAVSSDRDEAMRRLEDQATHDVLTGLFNEFGFGQWLAERDSAQPWLIVGVFFGGNQRLGALLGPVRLITSRQLIAQRMRSFAAVMTARVDSSRYAFAFPDTVESRERIADLRRAFARFSVSDDRGQEFSLHGATRVLRLHANDQPNAQLVMSTLATLAERQQSLSGGELPIHDFSARLQETLRQQTQRNEQIRRWILGNRIELFAQAILPARPAVVDPGKGGETAVPDRRQIEVLCRLRDDDGELVSPVEFLEVANQSGLAAQLDRQVITAVFDWLLAHPAALAITHKCAINLSSASLSDPEFVNFVRALAASHQVPPQRICFEITESNAIDDVERSRTNIKELRTQGFRVAIDDFGTGFATYSYLKRYQVDEIKIDGTFVMALSRSNIDSEIVQSIVRVARILKVQTIAEFVATDELRNEVERLGVDFVQGYAVGAPKPIAQLFADAV